MACGDSIGIISRIRDRQARVDAEEKDLGKNCDVTFYNVSKVMAIKMKEQLEWLERMSPRGATCEIKEVPIFDHEKR